MVMCGQFHAPAVLTMYPLDRRLGAPQIWLELGREGKNLCPCRESNPGRPAVRSSIFYNLLSDEKVSHKQETLNKALISVRQQYRYGQTT
jgi:hypothetical protein